MYEVRFDFGFALFPWLFGAAIVLGVSEIMGRPHH
jgi:hypothetical protein